MTYGPTLGALMTTTFARSAMARHSGRPSRSCRLAPRTVAVCAARVVAVTFAVAMGLAWSAAAVTAASPHVLNAATADQPLAGPLAGRAQSLRAADAKESGGSQLGPVRDVPDATVAPSEGGGFPWGAAAIGGVALGLIGLAISRARIRTRPGPGALSQ
jgi:hypothetical protein